MPEVIPTCYSGDRRAGVPSLALAARREEFRLNFPPPPLPILSNRRAGSFNKDAKSQFTMPEVLSVIQITFQAIEGLVCLASLSMCRLL